MSFIREEYKEAQRRKRTIISIVVLAAIVIFFISYYLFISTESPEETPGTKVAKVEKGDRKKAGKKEIKKEKDLPTIFAQTKHSVVLIKTFDRKDKSLGIGSGFFINAGGHLISNRHVFRNAHRAEVESLRGKFPVRKVVAESSDCDLVRLAVDIGSSGVTPLKISDSLPRIGEKVLVIGNPLGLESTVSDGIVSALRELEPFGTVIQITSPISPGSSGSPVLNMQGEVIGVATFQLREGQNLNFAIPIDRLKEMKPTDGDTMAAINYENSELIRSMGNPFDRGMVLFNGKNYESAISFFKKAVEEDPQNAEAYYHLGICYREIGSTDAVDAFKTAISIKPDYSEAYCHLGIAYMRLNMQEESINALKEALQITPGYDEALLNLGIAYALNKKYNASVSMLNKALEIFPHAKAYYYLGFSYSQLSKHVKAIQAFRESIDMNPDFVEAYLGLASSYAGVENWVLGIKTLNKAVIMEPQNAEVHFLLGILHLGNHDLESAQLEYEILKKQNASTELRNQLRRAISQYETNRQRQYR